MYIKISRTERRKRGRWGARAGGAVALTLVAAVSPPVSSQQPSDSTRLCLTLIEAEALALEGNRELRAGRARAQAAGARAEGAEAFLWPQLAAEAGFTRSDDPVAAFGTRLRQARFTQADFAVDALNHPDPVDDWVGAVAVRWSVLDPGRWAGGSAARHEARAARLGSERAAEAVVFRTRVLYLEALRAGAARDAARAAEDAAASTAALMRNRRAQGLLTDADVLQAEAALAGARARTVAAERAVEDARGRLALHLGLPDGVEVVPADPDLEPESSGDPGGGALPSGERASFDQVEPVPESAAGGVFAGPDVGVRHDLQASLARVEAAGDGVRRARAARLPSLEGYARLSSHAPEPFDGREADVTLGLQVSVPLFTGGAVGSSVEEARALERAARLEHEDRVARARTELAEARRGVDAARRGARAAEAARSAADEAQRLVRRRFEEGMATTAELLQAESRAADLRSAAVEAHADWRRAEAWLAFVRGEPGTTSDDGPDDAGPDDDRSPADPRDPIETSRHRS